MHHPRLAPLIALLFLVPALFAPASAADPIGRDADLGRMQVGFEASADGPETGSSYTMTFSCLIHDPRDPLVAVQRLIDPETGCVMSVSAVASACVPLPAFFLDREACVAGGASFAGAAGNAKLLATQGDGVAKSGTPDDEDKWVAAVLCSYEDEITAADGSLIAVDLQESIQKIKNWGLSHLSSSHPFGCAANTSSFVADLEDICIETEANAHITFTGNLVHRTIAAPSSAATPSCDDKGDDAMQIADDANVVTFEELDSKDAERLVQEWKAKLRQLLPNDDTDWAISDLLDDMVDSLNGPQPSDMVLIRNVESQ